MPSDTRAVEIVYGMLLVERQKALRDNVARHSRIEETMAVFQEIWPDATHRVHRALREKARSNRYSKAG